MPQPACYGVGDRRAPRARLRACMQAAGGAPKSAAPPNAVTRGPPIAVVISWKPARPRRPPPGTQQAPSVSATVLEYGWQSFKQPPERSNRHAFVRERVARLGGRGRGAQRGPRRTWRRRLCGSAGRRRAAWGDLSSLRPRCRRGGGCRQRGAAAAGRDGGAAGGPAGQLRGVTARGVPAGRAGRAAGRRAASVGRRGRGGRGLGPFGGTRGGPAALGCQLPPSLIVQHLEHVRLRGASAHAEHRAWPLTARGHVACSQRTGFHTAAQHPAADAAASVRAGMPGACRTLLEWGLGSAEGHAVRHRCAQIGYKCGSMCFAAQRHKGCLLVTSAPTY